MSAMLPQPAMPRAIFPRCRRLDKVYYQLNSFTRLKVQFGALVEPCQPRHLEGAGRGPEVERENTLARSQCSQVVGHAGQPLALALREAARLELREAKEAERERARERARARHRARRCETSVRCRDTAAMLARGSGCTCLLSSAECTLRPELWNLKSIGLEARAVPGTCVARLAGAQGLTIEGAESGERRAKRERQDADRAQGWTMRHQSNGLAWVCMEVRKVAESQAGSVQHRAE